MDEIILVDEKDNQIGTAEKLAAHKEGRLHRCFSIFVFDKEGRLMLQKRASGKYHCGGLWTNTCCSHPRPGGKITEEVHKRLKEEMGFDCELKEIFTFIYKTEFENGLTEHEYDHVFIGKFDGEPVLNLEEASEWKWISMAELEKDIEGNPDNYTYWLKIAIKKIKPFLSKL